MKKFSSCNSVFDGANGFELMTIETDIASGLYFFKIIGLADRMVQESRFRILSALRNSDFGIPQRRNEKVTVSLLPAQSKKSSAYSDLPIAAAYLIASKQIKDFSEPTILIGQISLDGSIHCPDDASHLIRISIRIALQNGIRSFVIPSHAERYIETKETIRIASVENLRELHSISFKTIQASVENAESHAAERSDVFEIDSLEGIDQHKRALQIALAGKHPILLGGMPGTGKSALARCAIELMDDLSYEQALDVQSAYASAQLSRTESAEDFFRPPLRMPHHNATRISLTGGMTMRHVGEISLANHGILLLDELCEFDRGTIESLREIFDHRGAHMRKGGRQAFISFEGLIIATTNLCPCGSAIFGDSGNDNSPLSKKHCRCTPYKIKQYQSRISNPMLDRFHIKTVFSRPIMNNTANERKTKDSELSGTHMRESIHLALQRQRNRSAPGKVLPNSHCSIRQIQELGIDEGAEHAIRQAEKSLLIPKRVVTNIFRLARTIADLDDRDLISNEHALEAIQLARTNPFYQ